MYIQPVYHPFSCLWLQFYCLLYHVHTTCVPSVVLFVTTILLFIVSCTYSLCTIHFLVCDYNSIVYCIMYIWPVYHPFSCLWLQFYCLLYHLHTACVPSVFLFVTTILLFIVSCTYSLCTIRFLVCDYNSIVYCIMYIQPVYHPFSCLWLQFYCLLYHVHTACVPSVFLFVTTILLFIVSCTYGLCTIRFLVCDYNSIVHCIMYIRPVYHPFSCLWLQFYCLLYHVHTACIPSVFFFMTTILLFIVSRTYSLCTIHFLVCDYNNIVYCIRYIRPVYHPLSCLWLQFYCLLYHVHTACVPSVFLFVTTILLFIVSCAYSQCTIRFPVCDYNSIVYCIMYIQSVYHPFSCLCLQFYCLLYHVHTACVPSVFLFVTTILLFIVSCTYGLCTIRFLVCDYNFIVYCIMYIRPVYHPIFCLWLQFYCLLYHVHTACVPSIFLFVTTILLFIVSCAYSLCTIHFLVCDYNFIVYCIIYIQPVYLPFSCLWLQFYCLLYHVHTACVPSIFLFVTTILLFIVSCTYGLCTIHFLVCDYNSIVYCIMYIQPVYHSFSCLWLQFYCLLNHVHTACVPSIFMCVTTILLFIVSCTYGLCTIHFLVCDYNSIVYCIVYIQPVYHPFSFLWLQCYCLLNHVHTACVPSVFLFVTTILLFIVSCTYSLCTIHFLVCDYNSIVYSIMYIRPVYHPFSCL